MSIEAMKLALEALTYCEALNRDVERQKIEAITALRQALEQAQKQERNFCQRCGKRFGKNDWDIHTCTPPQRQWVGLTDEEMFDVWLNEMPAPDKVFYQKLCRSVEAKLKEKNT